MARLIDADALMDDVMENGVLKSDKYGIVLDFGAVAAINNAPTIDAEPVRHGRWVWFENRPVTDADDPECIGCTGYECSECGNNEGTCIRFYDEFSPDMLARIKECLMEYLTNYCHNCGAKMGGGAEDGN